MTFALAFAWALAAGPGCPPPQEPDRNTALVADGKQRLAKIGIEVPASIRVVERSAAEVIADLDAQQDVLFPPGGFAVQHALLDALGAAAGKDEAAFRQQAIAAMARGLSAYYDPIQKSFVLLPTLARDTAELVAGSLLPLVVHELVHASQDAREGGLAGFFDSKRSTLDATLVRRCVLEGEAELGTVIVMLGESNVENTMVRGGVEGVEKMLAGELTALIYQHGRRLAGTRFRAAGWPGMRDLWQHTPASCEQVMHPEKLGGDLPQAVAVPEIDGTEVTQRTTLGELMTYFVLRQCGGGVRGAGLAAAGWDGDDFVLLRGRGGDGQAFVWRTVWDRDEDAAQFAAALPKDRGLTIATAGRLVDVVWAADASLRQRAAAACEKDRPELPKNDADAASTAAVEAAVRAADDSSAVHDERWEQPEVGLSVPVPPKWELREVQGMKILLDPATVESGFAVNVNVQVLPKGTIADLDALRDLSRRELEKAGMKVVEVETGKCGESGVVRGEFHGRMGRTPPMHCLQLMYLRGDRQVVVTATAAARQWERFEETLRALMAGITVTPP